MGHIGWLLVFSVFVLQDGVRVHDVGTYTCVGADAADLSSSLQLQGGLVFLPHAVLYRFPKLISL